jgi:hypothetical protein
MPPFGMLINPDYEAASGGFTPPDLTLCTSWFRADLGVSLSGSEVTDLADQSGAGILPTLTRVGALPGPTLDSSGIGGRADLIWDAGIGTLLAGNMAMLAGVDGITLAVIMQSTNTAAGRMWGMQYNAFHYLLGVNLSGGLGDGIASYVTEDITEARSDAPVNDGTTHIIIGTWSAVDELARIYIDGTTPAIITAVSATAPTSGAGDVNAAGGGSDGSAIYQGYTGRMPEFLSYGRPLDADGGADLVTLYNYLVGNT